MDKFKNRVEIANFDVIDNKLLKYTSINSNDNYKTIKNLFDSVMFNELLVRNSFYFENFTDNEFYDNNGIPNNKWLKFYQHIASSGVGLIITGSIDLFSKKHKQGINIFSKQTIEILNDYVKNIHSNGTKIFFQANSCKGRVLCNNLLFKTLKLSSSFNNDAINSNHICARISDGKLYELINNFVLISKFSKLCGFDGIMINGEIDNIVGELMSAEFNKRKFGYFSDKLDFSCKLLQEIKNNVKNLNIIYKITIDTFLLEIYKNHIKDIKSLKNVNKKYKLNIMLDVILKLINSGVDGFVITFGNYETSFLKSFNTFENEALFQEIYEKIAFFIKDNNLKNKFGNDISIVYTDNFNTLETSAMLKQNGVINFVDITKNIYADNNYLKSIMNNKNFQNCIKCGFCDNINIFQNKSRCLLNPNIFNEELKLNGNNKKVAVIGGGLSGIICSNTLAKRGYVVDLYEQQLELNLTSKQMTIFNFDNQLKKYNDYLENKLQFYINNQKINLKSNTKFNFTHLSNDYYGIVVATGFHEKFLNINGSVLKNVVSIYDALENQELFKNINNISIYAKTELAFKLALYLLTNNKKVNIIIEDTETINNLSMSMLSYYFYMFDKLKVSVFINSKTKRIEKDFVELSINNKFAKIDPISIAMNIKSKVKYSYEPKVIIIDNELFIYEPELSENNILFYEIVKNKYMGKLYMVGSALHVSNLDDIIKSAYFVGKNL